MNRWVNNVKRICFAELWSRELVAHRAA